MHKQVWVLCLPLLLVGIALSGCIFDDLLEEPEDYAPAEAYVLDYEVIDLRDPPEQRTANPGHHCGDTSKKEGRLKIGLWPDEEPIDEPWLSVFPKMPGHWHATLGAQPYKRTLPATIGPNIDDDPTKIAKIDWDSHGENGTIRVDSKAVTLPYTWTVAAGDGSWKAEATLSEWTGPLEYERFGGYCD